MAEADKAKAVLGEAAKNGKIRIGANECTKALERGTAKLVLVAQDVNPKEIVMHLPLLAKEKNIPLAEITTKKELGEAAGIQVGTSSVAVIDEGNAKKELAELAKKLK